MMPRTVIKRPRCSPRTFLTAKALEFFSLSEPAGIMGLNVRVYRRVSSAGNTDSGCETSGSFSAAVATASFRLSRWDSMMSSTSSLNLRKVNLRGAQRLQDALRQFLRFLRHHLVYSSRKDIDIMPGITLYRVHKSKPHIFVEALLILCISD